MSKRLLYRDPLAAAWMAKHFGMLFLTSNGCELYFDEDVAEVLRPSYADKFRAFIRPDSLRLLEVWPGDIIQDSGRRFAPTIVSTDLGNESASIEAASRMVIAGGMVIVQRNGIPFMWPESEPT